jgi:hypothetical protein
MLTVFVSGTLTVKTWQVSSSKIKQLSASVLDMVQTMVGMKAEVALGGLRDHEGQMRVMRTEFAAGLARDWKSRSSAQP